MSNSKHHQILIVGGGAAGITVAASIHRKPGGEVLDTAIIEPSDVHYYQPAFTLVGAGAYELAKTRRSESKLIPAKTNWIKDKVAAFEPENKKVELESGGSVSYDYLGEKITVEYDMLHVTP